MINVLLLNTSYEPLAVISQRRALALILKGQVEAVCEEVIRLHSRSTALDIPIVIRLRRYVNVPRRGIRWSRRAVLQRDNYQCIYTPCLRYRPLLYFNST